MMFKLVQRFILIVIMTLVTPVANAKSLPKDIELVGLQGGKLNLKSLKGKTVIFEFVASWCGSCSKVMGQIIDMTKNKSNIVFIPVSTDEDLAAARSYFNGKPAKIKNMKSKTYFDPETKFAEAMGVEALPHVVIVSPNGIVQSSFSGALNEARSQEIKNLANNRAFAKGK